MTPSPKLIPQPSLLRQINERAIFETLLRSGSASRSDLIRALGISAPTVHKAVARLIEVGLVEEVGFDTNQTLGRPSKVYRVASRSIQVLGISLDPRQTSVVRAGLDGTIDTASTIKFNTPSNYQSLISALERHTRSLATGPVQTIGVGISTPGELDFANQRILLSPNLHITDGKSVSADLQKRTGFNAVMYHETAGTCLSEWSYGAARGLKHFVMIGVYEGFGTSIVVDGRLLQGRDGMAGEFGHVTVDIHGERCGCGNRGCIETVATDQAFARRVSKRVGTPMSVEQIVEKARSGELNIRRELNETFDYLAIGAAAAINIFNPQAVLLCSRMFDADPEGLDHLREMIRCRTLRPLSEDCAIVRAEGDTRAGAVASIIHHITGSIGPTL